MWDMPSWRDDDGMLMVWDPTSKSYMRAPGGDINEKVDRGHASGGDNNLFDPTSDDGHMFQPGNPDNNGWLDGKSAALAPQVQAYAYQAAEEILANRKAQVGGWDIPNAEQVLEHFARLAGVPNDQEWIEAVHSVMDQTGEWQEGHTAGAHQPWADSETVYYSSPGSSLTEPLTIHTHHPDLGIWAAEDAKGYQYEIDETGNVYAAGLDGGNDPIWVGTVEGSATSDLTTDPDGPGDLTLPWGEDEQEYYRTAALEPYRDSDEFFGVEPPEPYMELGGQVAWDYAKERWPDLEWTECPKCGAPDSVSDTNYGPHCWNPECGWWAKQGAWSDKVDGQGNPTYFLDCPYCGSDHDYRQSALPVNSNDLKQGYLYHCGECGLYSDPDGDSSATDPRWDKRQATNQVQVKCPNCGELSQMEVCPNCGKGLEPEWNKLDGGKDVPWESLPQQGTPQNEFLSDPTDRVPKVNWGQQSSDFGTIISRVEVDASEFI